MLDWVKMERIVINHQRRRTITKKKVSLGYEIDHIIPYCISEDDTEKNLQLIKKKDHSIKSGKDRRIIKEFRKKGWIEKITNYSHQLMKPKKFLINQYKKSFQDI